MSKRCIAIHTYMSLPPNQDEYRSEYPERLLGVVGAKGLVLFFALVVLVVLAATVPGLVSEPVTGALVAVALGAAVALDRELSPEEDVDPVGLSVLVAAVVYTAAVAVGPSPGWLSALGASVVVLAATAYAYVRDGSVRPDVLGLLTAGTLVAYAALRLTGWTGFAHSPVFGVLVLLVGAGFVAASVSARPRTVEPEVEPDRDEELHRLLLGVLNDIADIPDEDVREDIASKMRLVAGKLEGVKIPTEVEDGHGRVPVVLPDTAPEQRHEDATVKDVLEAADSDRFTGYVVHGERDAVLMFRNGTLFKHYSDVGFGYEADSLGDSTGRSEAAFFALGHMPLNDLDDLTPTDEEILMTEEGESEIEASETGDDTERRLLEVGGDEIDIDDMFEKADEIIEDLSE